jgi:hypothetical protein
VLLHGITRVGAPRCLGRINRAEQPGRVTARDGTLAQPLKDDQPAGYETWLASQRD